MHKLFAKSRRKGLEKLVESWWEEQRRITTEGKMIEVDGKAVHIPGIHYFYETLKEEKLPEEVVDWSKGEETVIDPRIDESLKKDWKAGVAHLEKNLGFTEKQASETLNNVYRSPYMRTYLASAENLARVIVGMRHQNSRCAITAAAIRKHHGTPRGESTIKATITNGKTRR